MPLEKVIPSGCKIKFKSNNFAESNIIRRTKPALIKNRIRQCSKKCSKLREEIRECKKKKNNKKFHQLQSFLQWVHGIIFNSKQKVFKTTKANKLKKTNQTYYFKTTSVSRKPDDDNWKDKMINNLSSNPLNTVGKYLFHRGPNFAIFLSFTPIIYYITGTISVTQLEKTSLEKLTVLNTMPQSMMSSQNSQPNPKPYCPSSPKNKGMFYTTLGKMTSI